MEGFVGVVFGGDVLLSGLRQLVVVWGIVACGGALGSHYGDSSVVVDTRHETGRFPRELLF